jgi:hypothetical protein
MMRRPPAARPIRRTRALGIAVGEVLKTLAVGTGSGYLLMVIPASGRLDLHLAREALGDRRARLAGEEELGRDFPTPSWVPCPRSGRCSTPSSPSIRSCWATTP